MAPFTSRPLICLVALLLWLNPNLAWPQDTTQPAPPETASPGPNSEPVIQTPQPPSFERGFFLQVHDHDFAGAAAAFEKALADPGTPEHQRLEAKLRLSVCREDVVADDLAAVAPPDTLAYVELVKPGQYLKRYLERLAAAPPFVPAVAAEGDPLTAPAAEVLLPAMAWINPSLVDELDKIKGLAIAVSGPGQDGLPGVLVVLHPGDSDLVRGLIQMGLSALPPVDSIGGRPAYILPGPVWVTVTARTFLFSHTREYLEAAVARLDQPGSDCLATQFDFKFFASGRGQDSVFAHASPFKIMGVVSALLANANAASASGADSTGGSDQVGGIFAAASAANSDIHVETSLTLADGHGKAVYDLFRGAPLTMQTLAHVPRGAAAVAVLSMHAADDNSVGQGHLPPAEVVLHSTGAELVLEATPAEVVLDATSVEFTQPNDAIYATLRDVGRQAFTGVHEIGIFVMPSESPGENGIGIPELGLVLALNDAAILQMRVDQAFLIGTLVGGSAVTPPREIVIEGKVAREYVLPGVPPFTLVRMDEQVLVVGTGGAVAAAVRAAAQGAAIANDVAHAATLSARSPRASKFVTINAGRLLQMTGAVQRWPELAPLSVLIDDLQAIVAADEAPTQLTVRFTLTGLPGVPNLVRAFMQLGG